MASFLSATADEGLAMRFDQMRASVDVDDAMDARYREGWPLSLASLIRWDSRVIS